MLSKIYLILFVVALIGLSAVTYLAYNQLQSIGFAPATVVENFGTWFGYHWMYLWAASLVLLVLANIIIWTARRGWALWLTFLFFASSIVINLWWLSDLAFKYKKANALDQGGFNASGLGAAFFVVLAGIGFFFNHFLVFKLRDKMFGQPGAEATAAETPAEAE